MSKDCCDCNVDTESLEAAQRRVLLVVLGINGATFLMMVAAAWWSGSSALLSGTLDNLGDAVTYALSFAVVGASSVLKARVALFKGLLIFSAAVAVALQIAWRLFHLEAPIVDVMGAAALANLAANSVCLVLLTPYRSVDVNMASVWECSRNDVYEGVAVIGAAGLVWTFGSAWPDVIVATALLVLFLRSALSVLRSAWADLSPTAAA
jgi:Co/Zn/Cd efflux system component